MRQPLLLTSSLISVLTFASAADAAIWYVSPTGTATCDCTTRDTPCSLSAAKTSATAGDTVILMDGVYKESLYVANSGTADAWITFQADECSTPIIEGEGAGPMEDLQTTGVGSTEGEYLRFRGIVSRGWNIGFGNAWAGGVDSEEISNGHWDIENCIAYSNGRTGFTFFSAEGFRLKNAISAHNGSSVLHSWSSGVTLFEASGTSNLVESVISFENTDAQRHTDGSGFIVDEESHGATFINNVAFGNSGSCLRLTQSSGTKFINNTCYHNSQFGSEATGPTNPGEIYFTNGGVTQEGVNFMNNVIVGTGQAPAGPQPIVNQPSSGWTDNVVETGSVSFLTAPTGTNPDFSPASGATTLIGAGTTGNGAPTTDSGFDPKCIVKRTPVMVGAVASVSTWQYDVDIDYIKSIGGVAKCFNAAMRGSSNDIGAYQAGTITTSPVGACQPPTTGAGGMGEGFACPATGGAAGAAGAAGGGAGGSGGDVGTGGAMGGTTAGGTGGVATGGAGGATSAGAAGTASAGVAGTSPGSGGTGAGAGGSPGAAGTGTATGGSVSSGGSVASAGAAGAGEGESEAGGCGCRVAPRSSPLRALAVLGFAALAGLFVRRRRGSKTHAA